MEKLKIFVDCHVFDGTFQGTTSYLKGLYLELIKDKTKTYFLGATDIKHLKSIFGEHDNVVYLKYRSRNRFFRLLIQIPLLLKKHKIDYAHFQYVVPPIKICRYIVTLHDVLFLDFQHYFPTGYIIKNKFLFGWSAKRADIVLTVSEYSRKRIKKHFGINEITITSNAVDPVYFESYDKAAIIEEVKNKYGIQNYLLFVSRREPRKNHDRLLKTFVENRFYESYQLVFVGDLAIPNKEFNTYYETLERSIKDKVTILSKVKFDALLLLVRGARLAIYPSIAEGFGIPPLEALAAGVPSICSNTTAMSDFTFMKDCLFDPLNRTDIAEKINYALHQDTVPQKRESIRQLFSWRQSAGQFLEAINN